MVCTHTRMMHSCMHEVFGFVRVVRVRVCGVCVVVMVDVVKVVHTHGLSCGFVPVHAAFDGDGDSRARMRRQVHSFLTDVIPSFLRRIRENACVLCGVRCVCE